MGMFDRFTGTKRPMEGITPRSASEVHAALLALNRPDAPFIIRDGKHRASICWPNGGSSIPTGTSFSTPLA